MRNQVAGVAAVLVVICVVSALISPYLLTGDDLTAVSRGLTFVALITIGQASLMLLGELDLSLGTIGGLSGVVSGMLMVQAGFPPWAAIALAIALGALLGMTNGLVRAIGTAGLFGGAILGAAIIAVIVNVIVLTGVSHCWQSVVSGLLVVLAISFDSLSRRVLRRE